MIGGSAAPDIGLVRAADAACWFAVWTRSQCEPKVEEALRRKRLEVFLPRVRIVSRRRDGSDAIVRARAAAEPVGHLQQRLARRRAEMTGA